MIICSEGKRSHSLASIVMFGINYFTNRIWMFHFAIAVFI